MFRYKMDWWNDLENKVVHESGIIAANSYSKAAKILEENCTDPSGKCDLISIEIYELEHLNGAITDNTLLEIIEI